MLGYSRGAGVDARWAVIAGDPNFFAMTKRLHNHLHGFDGDGGSLAGEERANYEQTLDGNALELLRLVAPRDIVILHDPQTAGLVGAMKGTGATIIWRCHVGLDLPNRATSSVCRSWRARVSSGTGAAAISRSRAPTARRVG